MIKGARTRQRRSDALRSYSVLSKVFICMIGSFFVVSLLLVLKAVEPESPNNSSAGRLGIPSSSLTLFSSTINPVLRHLGLNVEKIYDTLLSNHPNPKHVVVMEVGAHRLKQTIFAAKLGFDVHVFDASPTNFAVMKEQYDGLDAETKDRITMYNNAVSSRSGEVLEFSAIGGTGDHVGKLSIDGGHEKYEKAGDSGSVRVKTISLDDVVSKLPNVVYLMKIDTQGHELHVFEGLEQTLRARKVRYILFEYWVDAMDESSGNPFGTCGGIKILKQLQSYGYQLFDLSVSQHPKAPHERGQEFKQHFWRPLDFKANCDWFASRGTEDRKKGYEMGYWTDMLAVSGGEFDAGEIGVGNGKRMKSII